MLIQLVIIQVITFVGVVVFLRLFFTGHLRAALKRLNALHEENSVKEAQLKEELTRAKEEREAEVDKGRAIAKELIEKAKNEILALRAQAEEQAKQHAQKLIIHGKYELEKMKRQAVSEAYKRALELAVEMIEYTFTKLGKGDLQRELIKEVISEIDNLGRDKFSISEKKVKVKSSSPLTDKEKERLREILSKKLDTEVTLKEEIVPELITGLVVEIGALVIDGSLKNRLRKTIPYLKKA